MGACASKDVVAKVPDVLLPDPKELKFLCVAGFYPFSNFILFYLPPVAYLAWHGNPLCRLLCFLTLAMAALLTIATAGSFRAPRNGGHENRGSRVPCYPSLPLTPGSQ